MQPSLRQGMQAVGCCCDSIQSISQPQTQEQAVAFSLYSNSGCRLQFVESNYSRKRGATVSHLALHDDELEPLRFCRVPDHVAQDRVCKWPDNDVGWAVHATVPGFTEDEFIETAFAVYRTLASACGIKPRMVQERMARVVLDVRSIDGDSGVLAESELPCGNVRQCHQWYDVGERWLKQGAKQKGIYLYLVILHETMHALGIGHAPQGVRAVIAPFYDPALVDLTPYDVQQLTIRYGLPAAPLPPVIPPVIPPVPLPPVLPPVIPPVPLPPVIPPVVPPIVPGGGFTMIQLLALLAKLGPIIDVVIKLFQSGQLQVIFEVLKKIGEALGSLPPSALKQAVNLISKEDLKANIAKGLAIGDLLVALTPGDSDDRLLAVLKQVLNTDWVLDLIVRLASYKSSEVERLIDQVISQTVVNV